MVELSRRTILAGTGAAATTGAAITAIFDPFDTFSQRQGRAVSNPVLAGDSSLGWAELRAMFPLSPDWIDLSAMLLNSHPAPVADAIARHRVGLDQNPVLYLEENNRRLQTNAREAAARYLGGAAAEDIALTDSTTMGVALVYHGLRLKPGQDILTTDQDYYVTHESLRLAAARSGANVRRIRLYEPAELNGITASELVDRVAREIQPATRVVALTWVHSNTGLKLPIAEIAKAIGQVNDRRELDDQVLLCVDGVHGFGNQDVSFAELGCDLLMTGCHKWLFGPRGTGIVAGTKRGWRAVTPTIPSFYDLDGYGRWMRDEPAAPDATTADAVTPGGFKAFEHVWALPEAFALHESMGRARVAKRTAELASQLKEGLAGMSNILLRTPRTPELSAGIVSFDLEGRHPGEVVNQLRQKKIIGSVAPYATPHVRLTPSVRNQPDEIETVLRAINGLA
jgi:selenocysteine lyase/cysteine desulfurase